MKKEIHPNYESKATISCACGAVYNSGSTRGDLKVEICSACHPFYTGKQKLLDAAGRVDKFKSRMEASKKMQEEAAKKAPKAPKKEKSEDK